MKYKLLSSLICTFNPVLTQTYTVEGFRKRALIFTRLARVCNA